MINRLKRDKSPYLLVISLYLFLTLGRTISSYMFLDGVTMAAISRNLSMGIGSFWRLSYTNQITPFVSHPPFGLWLTSLIFKIFGDQSWIESTWGTVLGLSSIIILIKIERVISNKKEQNWWTVFLLLTSPIITWCFSNNMLENIVLVLTLLQTLFIILSYKSYNTKRSIAYSILAGVLLSLSLLTKGPPTLFIIVLPLLIYIFNPEHYPSRGLRVILLYIVGFSLTLILFNSLSHGDFRGFSMAYIRNQLVPSMGGKLEVSPNRFLVLKVIFQQLLPVLIVTGISTALKQYDRKAAGNRWLYILLIIGSSGSLPFLLFSKQMSWYIMPSIPFFILTCSILTKPLAKKIEHKIYHNRVVSTITRGLIVLLFTSTLLLSTVFRGRILVEPKIVIRDYINNTLFNKSRERIYSEYAWENFNRDIIQQNPQIPMGSTIISDKSLHDNWRMTAFLQRVYGASLVIGNSGDFYLESHINGQFQGREGYKNISNNTKLYTLFIKR